MSARSWVWLCSLLVAGLSIACSRRAAPVARVQPRVHAVVPRTVEASPPTRARSGDPARGRELVQRFECNRCHEGTGLSAAPSSKNCFQCHEQIWEGKFKVSAQALARFRPHIADARDAPSLTAIGERFDRAWIRGYLLSPRDLRPKLTPTMPRLALSEAEAEDIAAYLTAGATPPAAAELESPSPAHGRELMEARSCTNCHAFSGVPSFPSSAPVAPESELGRSAALAPDLRFTRQRFRRDRLVAWLEDPKAIKPDTRMPNFGLSAEEARDLAAYVLGAELGAAPSAPFSRLPVLTRRVAYDEVNAKVFSRTCHHCHTDAEGAGGDGGPGNTGGFGFAPRGVSFSSHASILAGYLDAQGQRRSLFEPLPDGTPRLIGALLARHAETAQTPNAAVRGMPLGLPPLSAEDIQLVESWVVQGKPL